MKPSNKIRLENKWYKYVFFLFVLNLFLCSNDEPITGTVTETDTGIAVCMPDGSPAVDAVVKFIPANRTQATTLSKKASGNPVSAVVRTNSKGRFEVPKLADSVYNVFIEKDTLKAFQGAVAISPLGHAVHNDTLKQTGSFTGTVALDPRDMHNVKSVTVQILGSDIQYCNPDQKGIFSLNVSNR